MRENNNSRNFVEDLIGSVSDLMKEISFEKFGLSAIIWASICFASCDDNVVDEPETAEPQDSVIDNDGLQFSWDRVPRFLYITGSEQFSADELDYIAANYSWVTLAINFGSKDSDTYEEAFKYASEELKKRNPSIKLFYYWNASRVIDHYQANDSFNPEWDINNGALGYKNGEPIKLVDQPLPALNISIPYAKNWWIDNAKHGLNQSYVDGIWIDATARIYNSGPQKKLTDAGLWESTEAALYEMYAAVYQYSKQKSKIVLGNFIREHNDFPYDKLWPYFDGSFVENHYYFMGDNPTIDVYSKNINTVISNVQDAVTRDKIVGFYLGSQGEDPAYDMDKYSFSQRETTLAKYFEYNLALYLILAQNNVFFEYTDGFNRDNAVWRSAFPEYQNKLGSPKGSFSLTNNVYTREFENAFVELNIEDRTSTIKWNANE